MPTDSFIIEDYKRIKSAIEHNVVLLYRLGDFYEILFDDACTICKVLNLTLTTRGGEFMYAGCRAASCAIPAHCLESYIGKIVQSGREVAVYDPWPINVRYFRAFSCALSNKEG